MELLDDTFDKIRDAIRFVRDNGTNTCNSETWKKHCEEYDSLKRESYSIQEEIESLRERVANLEQENEALRKDAARYRWLRDATGETPLRPAAFGSEMYPDMRLKLDFPTIVSYDAVGNVTTLDQAIDALAQGEQ